MDYGNIELSQNRLLPKWLTCEIKNKCIRLKGIPREKEIGELLFRVENKWGFTVRDFALIIEPTLEQKQLMN